MRCKEVVRKVEGFNIESVAKTLELACLLHDVGHAPFSHTGETFFLDNDSSGKRYVKLHEELSKVVQSEQFDDDIPKAESGAAAPHEITSAIIGLKYFGKFFNSDFEREFFARCITGYQYSNIGEKESLYNCFISVLNSKIIDVDRLDYLIRDAYFTGFETVNIDYLRLLLSIDVSRIEDDDSQQVRYKLVYSKNAVSVIENVVYAHDSERKWIQTHPVVLYDMYIIQHIISKLNKKYKDSKLFSVEALSKYGVMLSDDRRVSLLCDDDVIHLLKANSDQDSLIDEYFSRNLRRHPLWKSEAEYSAYIGNNFDGESFKEFKRKISETEEYVRKYSDGWVINDRVLEKLEDEIEAIKNSAETGVDDASKNRQIKSKTSILHIMKCLKECSRVHKCEFDFVILKAGQFYSNFNKKEFGNIQIKFHGMKNKDGIFKIDDIISTLSAPDSTKEDFFYLYYKKDSDVEFNKEKFCKTLYSQFIADDM